MSEELQKVFDENHRRELEKKSSGKWGMGGTTLIDDKTFEGSLKKYYEYSLGTDNGFAKLLKPFIK